MTLAEGAESRDKTTANGRAMKVDGRIVVGLGLASATYHSNYFTLHT